MNDPTPRPRRRRNAHRSPNGSMRPYREGDRWVAPAPLVRRDGTPVLRSNGRPREVHGTGPTREIAMQRLRENLQKAQATLDEPEALELRTTTGWIHYWLAVIRTDLAYKTRVGYQSALDRWITPAIGMKPLAEVTREDVERLHAEVVSSGQSPSTWIQVRTVLNQSFALAARRGHVSSNPVTQAPKPGRAARSVQYLSADEARQVLSACSTPAEQARWLMALVLGARQGEVLALRWRDLDLDADIPVVRIERSLARQTGRGLVVGPTKTEQSRRSLRLPEPLVSALRSLRLRQKEERLALGQPWSPEHYVFGTSQGRPTDPAGDRKRWLALLDLAGVRRVRLHDARHTSATLMISGGTDIHVVSNALGHTSIRTTADVYGHVTGATVGAALEASARALLS